MSEIIKRVPKLLEERLAEVDAEAKQLRDALDRMGSASAGRKTASKPAGRSRGRKRRAAHGQRREQLLAVVKEKPGASGGEIAKEMGVSPNQVYTLARRLAESGELRKVDKGYKVTAKARRS